jgi:hypothetical protein
MSTALILLLAAGLFAAFWLDGARARELATALARSLCEQRGLQFLDDTVVLRRIGLRWGRQGIRFRRMFVFDFSRGGMGRRSGYLILVGTDVEQYGLDLPETPPDDQEPPQGGTGGSDSDGKVVPFRRPPT